MRNMLLALAASAALTAPAHAAIKFSDSFETETATGSTLNYNNFQNWDITDGTVDLIKQPGFGITCSDGNFCVDLDGSTNNPGVMTTKEIFSFNPYDIITVNLDASGSQRLGTDAFLVGLQIIDPIDFTLESPIISLAYNAAFNGYEIGPLGLGDIGGTFKLVIRADPGTPGSDNIGVVIDNVSLDISAVPEPATWAMMIAGFGLVGGALRTNRRRETLAAA